MKRTLIAIAALALAWQATAAGAPQWTWEAGKQTNNGSITVNSASGSTTYNVIQNPTGAVAKANQSASTQPPTVIIQATGGGDRPFNYIDHCYVFDLPDYSGYKFIGAGKLVGSKFTGILGYFGGYHGYNNGGGQVLSALTGMGFAGSFYNNYGSYVSFGSGNPVWCGADASCAWYHAIYHRNTVYGTNYYRVVGVASLPVVNAQKCYP